MVVTKNHILYNQVQDLQGRRLIDKSKSIKTFTMQIFEECGNNDIKVLIQVMHAMGNLALFNLCQRVESSSWDGRYGLVVCTHAIAIAMLVGPDAPIAFESKLREPNLASEYPVILPAPSFPFVLLSIVLHCQH
ncbi:hypothetical protein AAG906_025801 [Vitis piasezkii]